MLATDVVMLIIVVIIFGLEIEDLKGRAEQAERHEREYRKQINRDHPFDK